MTESDYIPSSLDSWKSEYSEYLELVTDKLDQRLDFELEYHDRVCIEVQGEHDSYYIEITGVGPHPDPINRVKLRYSDREVELNFEDSRRLDPTTLRGKSVEDHVSSIAERVQELENNPLKDFIDRELESESSS